MAAMTGFFAKRMAPKVSWSSRPISRLPSGGMSLTMATSMPAEKARGEAESSTATRTAASSWSAATAARISASIVRLMAFSTSGRFSVMVATPSWTA